MKLKLDDVNVHGSCFPWFNILFVCSNSLSFITIPKKLPFLSVAMAFSMATVTLFGKRGIKVNLENNVLTRLIGFVEKRGNAFCMRLNRFLMRLNNRLCCTSILHFVCWKVS